MRKSKSHMRKGVRKGVRKGSSPRRGRSGQALMGGGKQLKAPIAKHMDFPHSH